MSAIPPPSAASTAAPRAGRCAPGQAALVERLLPALSVPDEGPLDARTPVRRRRARSISRSASARGEHLAYRADLLPDHGFIGAEPFLNGVVGALGHIRDRHLANVRLHMGDALDVLERLPDARAALRLSAPPRSLAQGAPRQAADGQSRPARPDRRQAGARRRVPARHRRSGLLPLGDDGDGRSAATSNGWPRARGDFLVRPGGWPETRYEAKARREGREVWYFRYRRGC